MIPCCDIISDDATDRMLERWSIAATHATKTSTTTSLLRLLVLRHSARFKLLFTALFHSLEYYQSVVLLIRAI
jgi:hypothetical protein